MIKRGRVLSIKRVVVPTVPVHDLTISNHPYYFANGLLVHNCVIIDEAQRVSDTSMSQVILPMIGHSEVGKVIKLGVPRYRNHFFKSFKSNQYVALSYDWLHCPNLLKSGYYQTEIIGNELGIKYPKSCLVGETSIPLLSGKSKSIKELAEQTVWEDDWSYSVDEKQNIVAGRIVRAWKVGSRPTLKITLDNGESFRCTPDHLIMMRDGTYREASLVKVHDSLMPLYRRSKSLYRSAGEDKLYEEVYNPGTNRFTYTHRRICPLEEGYVVHHRNFDRFDNRPANLELMTYKQHANYHAEHLVRDSEYVQKLRKGAFKFWEVLRRDKARLEARRAKTSKSLIQYNAENKELVLRAAREPKKIARIREATSARWKDSVYKAMLIRRREQTISDRYGSRTELAQSLWQHEPYRIKHTRTTQETFAYKINAFLNAHTRDELADLYSREGSFDRLVDLLQTQSSILEAVFDVFKIVRKRRRPRGLLNHKVVSVEEASVEDVYDMEVDTHHNFAVGFGDGSGIVVHNCVARMPYPKCQYYFPNNPELWNDGDMSVEDFETQYEMVWLTNIDNLLDENDQALLFGTFEPKVPESDNYFFGLDLAGGELIRPGQCYSALTIGRIRDGQKQVVACLSGDTTIPLLNGTNRSIKELVDGFNRPFWVYSYDNDTKEVVPGLCTRAWKTGTRSDIYKITLDNGESFRCTSDHLIMTRGGAYKRADELNIEDSLMPLYRKLYHRDSKNGDKVYYPYSESRKGFYEILTMPGRQTKTGMRTYQVPTHLMVALSSIRSEMSGAGRKLIHHRDLNSRNNEPTNLTAMSRSEHALLHRNLGRKGQAALMKLRSNPEYESRFLQHCKDVWTADRREKRRRAALKYRHSEESIKNCSEARKKAWAEGRYDHLSAERTGMPFSEERIQNIKKGVQNSEKFRKAQTFENYKKRVLAQYLAGVKIKPETLKKYGIDIPVNHKVTKIEKLDETIDVYDLSVETHHNFAVGCSDGSGVFVHNCYEWQGNVVDQIEEMLALVHPSYGKFRCKFGLADYGEMGPAVVDTLVSRGVRMTGVMFGSSDRSSGKNMKNAMSDHALFELRTGRFKYPTMAYVQKDKMLKKHVDQWFAMERHASTGINAKICLSGDTRVPLLDGRTLTMRELAELPDLHDLYTITLKHEKQKITAGKILRAWKTGTRQTLKVTLDNNESFKCTPDHLIMMRDGIYKEAKDLQPNDSLMPLYRSYYKTRGQTYTEIYNPLSNSWKPLHQALCFGNNFYRGYVIHHKDYNAQNNNPENLLVCTQSEHMTIHSRNYWKNLSPQEKKQKMASLLEGLRRHQERMRVDPEYKKSVYTDRVWSEKSLRSYREKRLGKSTCLKGSKNVTILCKQCGKSVTKPANEMENRKFCSHYCSDTYRKGRKRNNFVSWSKGKTASTDERLDKSRQAKSRARRSLLETDPSMRHLFVICTINKLVRKLQSAGTEITEINWEACRNREPHWNVLQDLFKKFPHRFPSLQLAINHKVLKIEEGQLEDVFDLEIEDYHNFALDCGVFVHNCSPSGIFSDGFWSAVLMCYGVDKMMPVGISGGYKKHNFPKILRGVPIVR